MTFQLSLLVEVPSYEDLVASVSGLRCRGVELVVISDDRSLEGWPGTIRVDPGPCALNTALSTANAPVVALADAGGMLDCAVLDRLLRAVYDRTGTSVVYSDERVAGVEVRKPGWSPTLFGHHEYLKRLTLIPRELAIAAGGFASGSGSMASYPLLQRIARAGISITHVPVIAYERLREEVPYLIQPGPPSVPAETTVSVILPTAGTRAPDGREPPFLASRALDATLRAAEGLQAEVVCPVGPEVDPGAVEDLRIRGGHILKVVQDRKSFHFSRRVNLAVARSEGDVLVWLNDDVERHTDDRWLRSIVATALIPDVGGVGPKLLYPDDTVQTVGVRFHNGLPKHTGVGARAFDPGPMRTFITPHEQLAVTGAVFATRRKVYDEVGGLTETLPVNFGDIDYCLKAQAKGYRVLIETGVTLVHHESASRPLGVDPLEFAELARRWSVSEDPFWPWPDDADHRPPVSLNGSHRTGI